MVSKTSVEGANVPARSRRRVGRPSQREAILEAAVESFANGGTRGTTLARIADSIGVTVPAILHHFGSKEMLLREVVARRDTRNDEVLSSSTSRNALEQLAAHSQWAQSLVSDQELANLTQLATIMTAEALDPDSPVRDEFQARHEQFRQQLITVIKKGKEEGSIRPDVDARRVATEVIAFMQGAQLQWFLDRDRVDLVGVLEGYFDRLEDDLAASRPRKRRTR